MKTPITTGTFIALGLSVVLGYAAQQQSQPAQPQTSAHPTSGAPPGATTPGIGSQRNDRLQTTTLTGCLRQGASRTYVLEQSPGTSVPNGGIGTVGGRDQRGNRYDLVIDSKTDASKMVGRQVEVMGMETITPINSGSSVTGAGRSGSTPGASTTSIDRTRPNTSGVDKDAQRDRTGDQPTIGGGTGERERSPGDAGLTRFTVKTIKQTGSGC